MEKDSSESRKMAPIYPGKYELQQKPMVKMSDRQRLARFLRRPKTTDIKNRYRFNRFV